MPFALTGQGVELAIEPRRVIEHQKMSRRVRDGEVHAGQALVLLPKQNHS